MRRRAPALHSTLVLAVVCLAGRGHAQGPPPGYYASVDDTSPAALRATLHQVIDDHTRFPYTSGATDTWDILEQAQQDPASASRILDVYLNASYVKQGGGNSFYEREHTWPKSYGFPDDGVDNYPYTDCHMLWLCNGPYNFSRSNKPFRYCSAGHTEEPTLFNNGQGGGSGVYPGNSNWTTGNFTQGTWETWIGRRGDVARTMFYADVRYEGGTHGGSGFSEPDLILTDSEGLIGASNTGNNLSVGYMGMLSVLLQWHQEDPVDAYELRRNDVVFSYQQNRNPFVDHPEWVGCLYSGACGSPPAAPTGLVASAGVGAVDLVWNANGEPDLAGYNAYRAGASGGPYARLNLTLLGSPSYSDTTGAAGITYFYVVAAEDSSGFQSPYSLETSATPQAGGGGPSTQPWVNELHYDNAGTDQDEMVELAGPAGLDLAGWTVEKYNGANGQSYGTVALFGVFPDQGGCIGTLDFDAVPLQNGLDGVALVDPSNAVVQFLSWEGTFTASDGPALGMTSVDIGVQESSLTAAGLSLQLTGVGNSYADFAWQSDTPETRGLPNAGQTFSGGCPSGPVSYCTAGTSASGCTASLSASGTPSASATSGFDLVASTVEGAKDGLFFFGANGRQANPWGNGTSLQCVVPPVARGGLLASTGSAGACDGSFTQDLNALWCPTCPKPLKNPGAGALVQAQLWYRDPLNTSNQTTSLSDALEFSVAP